MSDRPSPSPSPGSGACRKIHAAPVLLLSSTPPEITVSPSDEMATEYPCSASPTAPVPTSGAPERIQSPLLRRKRVGPPVLGRLPAANEASTNLLASPDNETSEAPPGIVSREPCCDHVVPLRVN